MPVVNAVVHPDVPTVITEDVRLSTRMRLSRLLAQHPGRRMDLDVEHERGHRVAAFRVVAIPGRDKAMTRLCVESPSPEGEGFCSPRRLKPIKTRRAR